MDPSSGHTIALTHRTNSRRAGCGANSHVRFGERTGETDQPKRWHRAPVRLHWGTEALDLVRRDAWNNAAGRARDTQLTRQRTIGASRALKNTRMALWKNPEDLTENQQAKIAWVARTDPRLYRAYLLKEGLRYVFKVKGEQGKEALDRWLAWAARCRIPAFLDAARKIRQVRPSIDAALDHRLSNALIESMNTKIRVITRMAFGFKNPHALIALAILSLGGYKPDLPGRT